jgi:hypothetical protein
MKAALLSLALIGSQLTIPVSDHVPRLNVEETCKAIVADDKASGLALPQSYEGCMRDENAALQQLGSIWSASPGTLRNQCTAEATAGGSDSYVDLLTCIQMAGWAKSTPSATELRGASKNRNKK